MARKTRIQYKGCLYHIMVRGNNGEFVFDKEEDKQMYAALIRSYKEKYSFKLYSYCVLDNHVHLLIEQEDEPLSKIMQGIQQSYTQRYNKKYYRTGHVFQQRYKANICNKDQYLLQLIRYIHYNPVEAGLDKGINYKWSSHNEYISNKESELIEVDYILGLFGDNKKSAVESYKKFMEIGSKVEKDDISQFLLEEIQYCDEEKDNTKGMQIAEIINIVCELEGICVQEVIKRSKIRKYSDIRKAIVLLSEKYFNITATELAGNLNIPLSMVSKIKSGGSKRTEYVNEIIEKFENKVIIEA